MEDVGIIINIGLIVALALSGLWMVIRSRVRRAPDVLADLHDEEIDGAFVEDEDHAHLRKLDPRLRSLLNDELGKLGIYGQSARTRYVTQRKLIPIVLAGILLLLVLAVKPGSIPGMLSALSAGILFGTIAVRSRDKRRAAAYIRSIEFFLPVVMERIVMAVEAGLDILPAIKAVVDLERAGDSDEEEQSLQEAAIDPVSRLLGIVHQLSESGLGVEQALKDVAELVECPALRHAFIHLGVAQKEGGELIVPLRELSDSTQLYYQETVEEEIAKMPVKATAPLLCTFGGLIICFITSPLIQVMTMLSKAVTEF